MNKGGVLLATTEGSIVIELQEAERRCKTIKYTSPVGLEDCVEQGNVTEFMTMQRELHYGGKNYAGQPESDH